MLMFFVFKTRQKKTNSRTDKKLKSFEWRKNGSKLIEKAGWSRQSLGTSLNIINQISLPGVNVINKF